MSAARLLERAPSTATKDAMRDAGNGKRTVQAPCRFECGVQHDRVNARQVRSRNRLVVRVYEAQRWRAACAGIVVEREQIGETLSVLAQHL